jgi:heptaprenylglyceryl phosphate synthase
MVLNLVLIGLAVTLDPGQSRALLARVRTWIDTHTDQVIIAGSLIIGLWFITDSIYLIVT